MEKTQYAAELQAEFTYEGESSPALRTEALEIPPGRCVVLCGGSGCGKTTLLRCLNQLIPQFYEGSLKGFGRIGGQELSGLSIGETGRLAASVFQDPRSQFFTLNSSLELAFGLENFGFSQAEIERRVKDAFSSFGMEYLMDRDVFSLSSGERQLIAILAARALDTELFLLDEPSANLDCQAVSQLAGMLGRLKAQGKTLLISEHRLYYLRELADEYWFMDRGAVCQKFSRSEMLSLSPARREQLGLRMTELSCLENTEKQRCPPDGAVFSVENLSFSYGRRGRPVLTGLSLSARQGEVVGLIGRNGCGKTSLGKLAAGLLKPRGGSFSYNGSALAGKALQRESIFIMQEAEFQFFTNSVLHELSCGREMTEEKQAETEALLRTAGLWEYRNRHPFTLSGGQMQRLVLLLACLSPKPVVILDEPTAGLDYGSLTACAGLIRQMQKSKIVFIITHDPELISQVCTRCCRIEDGRIGEEFDLTESGSFERLKAAMESMPGAAPPPPSPAPRAKPQLDPRVKIFVFLLAMLAGIGTDTPVILGVFCSVLLIFVWERRWLLLLSGALLMGGMYLLYGLFPSVGTAFLISFFPRVLVICFGAWPLAGREESSRSLAALRKLRVPEKVIMIFSVILRFFPVLSKDLKLMNQSIRTRGFFPRPLDRLKAAPQYLEIMLVPMVFRVIRIAEALSASAETRGIALKGRRDSLIVLKCKAPDILMFILASLLFAAGLIL